jgi:hypothetical protein
LSLAACLLVAVALLPASAGAARSHHRHHVGPSSTPTRQLVKAGVYLKKVPARRLARGKHTRSALVSQAAHAAALARARRSCAALEAANALSSALQTPTTWARSQIPRALIRKPLRLIVAADRALLRRAGHNCARSAKALPLQPHKGGAGPAVPPPNENPEQGEGLNQPIPPGPFRPPKTIGGASGLNADAFGASVRTRRGGMDLAAPPSAAGRAALDPFTDRADPIARIASNPLNFFRNSDVGVPVLQPSPQEVTAAVGEEVVWYTGNTSDALSTNGGRTFTVFNPSNVLPDEGLSFCCDQVVSYSPTYHMFVWVMQYWCSKSCLVRNSEEKNVCRNDGVFNRIRIAVASPADLRANASNPGAAWTYWDVTPSTIGENGGNAWFDRSDLSVNSMNMNWTVDVLCGSGASVLGRIPLEQLSHRGTVTLSYAIDSPQRMTTMQGLSTTTTYFVGANSLSQERIWSWEPFSGTLFLHNINHSSVPIYDNEVKGTDGGNWYDRWGIFPGAIESATLQGSTMYVAQGTGRAYCTSNCSSEHPTLEHVLAQPSVLITKYDVNTWSEVGERWLWNPTLALGWPALQTNTVGDVGIALRAGANNTNAQPVAGFLTPEEQFTFALPAGLPHETGDYYTLRPGRTSESFVMTGQTVESTISGPVMHWNYMEYGHGTPPYVAPPNVHITAPANLTHFKVGQEITYAAEVSDPIDGTLPEKAIVWTEDGNEIGRGAQIVRHGSPAGFHTITVKATNGDGKSASASITVAVEAPPEPGAPIVSITSPKNGQFFGPGPFNEKNGEYCVKVKLEATATGGAGPLSYSWTDSVDGGTPSKVSTQLSPELEMCAPIESTKENNLALSVSDGVHSPTTAFITVYVVGYKIP